MQTLKNTIKKTIEKTIKTSVQKLQKIPRLTALTVIIPASIVILIIQITDSTVIRRYLDQKIYHPALFRFKEWLRPSTLDSRIKIFAFDNRTAAYLKSHDLSLEDWARTIRAIGAKDNVKIMIPKIFDVAFASNDIDKALQILKTRNPNSSVTNIIYTSPNKIDNRLAIDLELLLKNTRQITALSHPNAALDRNRKTNLAYGAESSVLQAFSAFGHAEYKNNNRMDPMIALENGVLVPQLALAGVGNLKITPTQINIMGHPITVSDDGSIIVNTLPDTLVKKHTLSLLAAVILARGDKDIPPIRSGDYVIIIPALFTGSTDYVETALGTMPGSFLTVSMLNSALQGTWIREFRDPGFFVIVTGMLAFFGGFLIRPTRAALILILTSTAMTLVSFFLFSQMLFVFPLLLPALSLFVGGLSGLITQSNVSGIEDMRMQKELEIATVVQKSFFPQTTGDHHGPVRVIGRFSPASECGGDWWGQMRHGGFSYFMIGDAVGHGVPAALVTAAAFSATKLLEDRFSAHPDEPIDPATILTSINAVLCSMNSELACMTFLAMRIHDESGESLISNAGNPQPLIIPADPSDPRLSDGQRSKLIPVRGDVLGLSRDIEYNTTKLALMPGDRILFYTDGLIENIGDKTKKPLGKKWIRSAIPGSSMGSDFDLAEQLWKTYQAAIGSTPPNDDTTLVMISYHG
jgi:serine phosphatase RsbU (regulator of sigma subunit)